VAIVGEMAIRMSFASRGSKRREWQRSGLTRTSTTLPMVYLSLVCRCPRPRLLEVLLPRLHRSDRCGAPVRPVQAWTGSRLGFVLVQVRGLFLEVVVLVVGLESLQVVRLLGILPLEFTTGMGGVVALRRRGGTVHGLSFVALVFVEVALVGEMVWFVLTPLSSKWLGTGFTLLVLTLVLSRLFTHVLVF
jgi:hypothetical protein